MGMVDVVVQSNSEQHADWRVLLLLSSNPGKDLSSFNDLKRSIGMIIRRWILLPLLRKHFALALVTIAIIITMRPQII